MSEIVLEAVQVSKSFGGVHACVEVDLSLQAGQVTALIGPNGAGKTSLFNCLSGHSTPDRGTVTLAGQDVTTHRPHEFAALGLARTFQNLETFASMSLLESVRVGAHLSGTAGLFTSILRLGRHDREERELTALSHEALERVGIGHLSHQVAASVDPGSLRLAEIARAIVRAPEVLFLDEPVAGLSAAESSDVADVIVSLAADGAAVMISEHDLPTVMAVADYVYVLHNGRVISNGLPAEIRSDPLVVAAYLGEEWDPRAAVQS